MKANKSYIIKDELWHEVSPLSTNDWWNTVAVDFQTTFENSYSYITHTAAY